MKIKIIDMASLVDRKLAPSTINSSTKVTLSLYNVRNVHPSDMTHIMCLIDLLARSNCIHKDVIYPRCEKVKSYCGRMGLFNLIPSYTYPNIVRQNRSLVELQKIDNENNDYIAGLVLESLKLNGLPIDHIKDDLHTAITEVANNVFYHSGNRENEGWGYFSAQFYPSIRTFEFSFCDLGIGFRGAFNRTFKLLGLASNKLIEKAMERHVSSIIDPMRGIGLNEVCNIVRAYKGEITIQSHDGYFHIPTSGKIVSRLHTENPFVGTSLDFRIKL
ncbi:hypothetical protein HBN50_07885 [Halobacteriovorax sp. GB3]|uniref:hypothetical protein n=1 Tax=Halobacteriovorax sp. GB3 TaxID=2719615 RepID=UPI002360BDBC|nr:hypothetical protein [Halobacteriovorax sp. GB3]MDD0853012.1 hypothetical protein [Halobacteriovorax sp. GB3]